MTAAAVKYLNPYEDSTRINADGELRSGLPGPSSQTRNVGGRMPRGRKASPVAKELAAARHALRVLEKSLLRLGARLDHYIIGGVAAEREPRRRMKLTPARVKALRLHGRYLGYMRQLKAKEKAQVKALREKKGVRAAIARAREIAGK